jgi:hypothetical protein
MVTLSFLDHASGQKWSLECEVMSVRAGYRLRCRQAPGTSASFGLAGRQVPDGVERTGIASFMYTTTLTRCARRLTLTTGETSEAVELLEHGRGVLHAQVLDTNADLTALEMKRPDLAARIAQLRDQLNLPGSA